jgi:hypothetical protein
LTELLPIYEELEDGSEVMWAEHAPRKLKNLKKMVRTLDEFNTDFHRYFNCHNRPLLFSRWLQYTLPSVSKISLLFFLCKI